VRINSEVAMKIPEALLKNATEWRPLIEYDPVSRIRVPYTTRGLTDLYPCVYVLKQRTTGEYYIGSTGKATTRIKAHASYLQGNLSHSVKLQTSFNRDKDFEFMVIFTESREEAYEFEQLLLDMNRHDPLLLNESIDVKRPGLGRKLSPEQIAAMQRGQKTESGLSNRRAWTDSPQYSQKAREQFSKPAVIDGVQYPSATAAGLALGVHKNTVIHRLKSDNPKFKDWNWL
jgi:predicted GIY-YIG superfamily endonuclease